MGNFNRDNRSGGRRSFGSGGFGRRSFGGHGGDREMHKAVCSDCGKNCEVPFEPTGSKPVYCSECFGRTSGASSRRFSDRGSRRPDFDSRNEPRPQNNQQLEAIDRKLDKILAMLTIAPLNEEKEINAKPEEITIIAPKKTKTSKKKTSDTKE